MCLSVAVLVNKLCNSKFNWNENYYYPQKFTYYVSIPFWDKQECAKNRKRKEIVKQKTKQRTWEKEIQPDLGYTHNICLPLVFLIFFHTILVSLTSMHHFIHYFLFLFYFIFGFSLVSDKFTHSIQTFLLFFPSNKQKFPDNENH